MNDKDAFGHWLDNFVKHQQRPPTALDVWEYLHPILVSRTKKLNRCEQRNRKLYIQLKKWE